MYKYGFPYSTRQASKMMIIIMSFTMIRNSKSYFFLFKAFAAIVFFSMVFGFLVHYFGEPFASIRMAILGNQNEYAIYYSKGDRLVGFDNKIFIFGYVLSVLPILLLTLYKIEQRNYILLAIAVSVVGIILNGERAAAFFSVAVFLVLTNKWFYPTKSFVIFGVLFGLFILFETLFVKIDPVYLSRLYSQKQEGEFVFRIGRQFAALLSVLKSPLVGGYNDTYARIFIKSFGVVPSSSHNAYINIGLHGGISGWLLFLIFGRNVMKSSKTLKARLVNTYKGIILYEGIIGAFFAALSVGLTHNAGIFDGEKTAIILLGFIIAGASISFPKKPFQDG